MFTISTFSNENPIQRIDTVTYIFLINNKARLDGALSNLAWWKVSQPMAGGLELDGL